VPTQVGNYSVELIQSGCTNISSIFPYISLGIRDYNSSFGIYPNPVKTKLFIKNNVVDSWTNVEITNLEGKNLHSEVIKNSLHELNFSNYATGVYIIVLSNSTKKQQFKVVKE